MSPLFKRGFLVLLLNLIFSVNSFSQGRIFLESIEPIRLSTEIFKPAFEFSRKYFGNDIDELKEALTYFEIIPIQSSSPKASWIRMPLKYPVTLQFKSINQRKKAEPGDLISLELPDLLEADLIRILNQKYENEEDTSILETSFDGIRLSFEENSDLAPKVVLHSPEGTFLKWLMPKVKIKILSLAVILSQGRLEFEGQMLAGVRAVGYVQLWQNTNCRKTITGTMDCMMQWVDKFKVQADVKKSACRSIPLIGRQWLCRN